MKFKNPWSDFNNSKEEVEEGEINIAVEAEEDDVHISLNAIAVKSTLQRHRGKHKKRQALKNYACGDNECGKMFTSRTNMLNHMKQIHLEIKYECDNCDYKASQKGALTRHQLAKHGNGIRHFRCLLCPKSYKWEVDLMRHTKKHSDNKFRCNGCEKQFSEKRNLRYHMKSVHLKLRIKCSEENCSFEAPNNQRMKEHKIRCHGVAHIFKCNFCFYQTGRKSELIRHIKRCVKESTYKNVINGSFY